jgi:hypothetical protein
MSLDDTWIKLRWDIARATGWTFEVIDSLSADDIQEYISIRDGEVKAGH